MKLLSKYKRAISPLLATIILVAITVAAGLVIYNLFFSTAGTVSSAVQIDVVSCDLVKTSTRTLLSVTIKNSGTRSLSSCQLYIWDMNNVQRGPWNFNVSSSQISASNVLNPGGFAIVRAMSGGNPDLSTSYIVGNTYPVRIVVTATDGSTFEKSFTVACTGSG